MVTMHIISLLGNDENTIGQKVCGYEYSANVIRFNAIDRSYESRHYHSCFARSCWARCMDFYRNRTYIARYVSSSRLFSY